MLSVVIFFFFYASNALAVDYSYIDPGDYYYINNWGDNDHVVVVRKLGSNQVKVRNLSTGSTQVISASKLLTKSQLDTEETGNAIGGAAIGIGIIYCLANPEACSN